jgi:hypothetical protein
MLRPGLFAVALAALAAPAFAQTYKAPRTAYGQPDLQGVWSNATITPLTRPAKFGDRLVLTPQEAAAQEQSNRDQVARADAPTPPDLKVTDLKNADCGADGISGFNCGYNQGWKDPGTSVVDFNGEKRSSILTSPANGQFPPTTKEAQARRGSRGFANADGPEARGLGERCILAFGSSAGPPMLPNGYYNNNYEIIQTPDAVLIQVEMVHDTRIVRLNAKHHPSNVKAWMGDSIGWWEGDTLVIETINMRPEQGLRGGSSDRIKVTEWLTRIGPNKIRYKFTLDDPGTYTAPVTGEVAFNATKGPVYEYACHEGNYAMEGILAGAREAEKAGATVQPTATDEGGD